MAIRPLNSVAGFSVGETPANIILANGDITTTNITTTGVTNLNSVGNVKISGGGSGQVLSTDGAGNLSFITIGTASLNNGTSNVTVLNNGNILFSVAGNANVGTFTGTGLNVDGYLTASGNITGGNANLGNAATANFFIGAGNNLSNIQGANVSGTVANANYSAYAGNVTGSSQGNITSVGTLTTLNVNATVNAVAFSSNVATGTAPLTVQSNTVVANLNADLLDGYNSSVSTAANTVVVRDGNGNVSANFFIGDGSQLTGIGDAASIANGTSNVRIPTVNGNVTIGVSGNSNVVVITGTGANIDGYANITGNVTAGNISANIANLTTANVTGNVVAGGVKTDNLYYANGNPWDLQQPAGSNNEIQYNSNGSFGASANFTFNDATQVLNVSGTITASNVYANSGTIGAATLKGEGGNISNIQGANVSGTVSSATTAGTVTTNAQPNITSVGTLSSLTVTGNISGGNLNTAGKVVASTLESNVATGTAPLTVSSTTRVANLNVDYANLSDFSNLQDNVTNTTRQLVFVSGSGNTKLLTTDNFTINPANAYFAGTSLGGTLTTAAQPNITSVGTLSNLSVTGNVTSGNVYANSGTIGANLLTGTLTTAAQPNITSVGTLSSLGVTGDISGANITANTKIVTDAINNQTGNLVITTNSNVVFSTTGVISAGTSKIANVGTPTSDADAATKAYVDNLVSTGIHYHPPVRVESPTALNATYNNGTDGVGATLTNAGSNVALTVDGISLNVADRVLVYTQANAVHNGVYVVSTVGDGSTAWVLTRSSDTDTYAPSTDAGLDEGSYFYVQEGVTGAGESYVCSTPGTIIFGTTAINFVQFSKAPIYTAGTGLGLYGNNQFYLANTTVTAGSYGNGDSVATFTVNGQGQLTAAGNSVITANAANLTGTTLASTIVTSSLTSVGTLGNLNVTANITAGNVYANSGTIGAQTLKGEGGNISNIQGGNVSGAVSFATTANSVAGANVSGQVANALVAGTVYTNAQPNITSVGTLTSLSVTGNVSTGNISGTNGNLTTANISSNVILGNSTVTTQLTWASVTTTSTTPNQTIASISATGITGVEYLVKAIDSAGSKYSVASVIAVTDGANVDYSTYGTVQLGGYTGSLAVNVVGGQLRLQVTPASSNSTVWTTQYRLI